MDRSKYTSGPSIRLTHHRPNVLRGTLASSSASQLLWSGGILCDVKVIERTPGELLCQVQLPFPRSWHARNVNNNSAPEAARKKSDIT